VGWALADTLKAAITMPHREYSSILHDYCKLVVEYWKIVVEYWKIVVEY